MTFDVSKFRTTFPEFSDAEKYPSPLIEFWAGLASQQVRSCIWKDSWIYGVSLYTAHELVLATQNQRSASVGGVPGQSGGIANNKTVGQATIGYDTTSSTEEGAGYWNLTNYGKQFYRLVRVFGAGCIQL